MREKSYYTDRLEDELAVYFTKENYEVNADGIEDVSDSLQEAIYDVVRKAGYGVLYVPDGRYLLSKTIYIPKAVRIIGYGQKRPEFILKDNVFISKDEKAKGNYRYLFWFINQMVEDESLIEDANPGTFYSAMSNVNISLGQGNTFAVALRTHYAQHSFLNHMNIKVESGMAGIYDVGNEIEDIHITGGNYGIITTKCSPGWPFVMSDCSFNGQKNAAILTRETGWNIIRCYSINTSKFIDVEDGYFEKIYIEDSIFEDMNCIIDMAMEKDSLTQINMYDCQIKSVENIVRFKDTEKSIANEDYQCILKKYVHGIVASDEMPDKQLHDEIYRYAGNINYSALDWKANKLPKMNTWINAKNAGLVGDGISDDTEKLKELVNKYETIYFPQGNYLLTDTIKLNENTTFIGMNPISTKFTLKDNVENYGGIGKAKALIETSTEKNIIMGIGIDTGGRNPRACGIKWMCNEDSYMNDVKFLGGHGNLVPGTGEFDMPYDEGRCRDIDLKKVWDYQYPSLLICNGGGTIKDIWSASPYVTAGVEIRNNARKLNIYCLSLEHHVRCELRIVNSENVNIYGFQSEEEKAEGEFAQPIEMYNCKNIKLATAYFFRTIFVEKPYAYCVKTCNCSNIQFFNVHNFSQMKYTITNFLLDVNSNTEIRTWQAAKVKVTGKVKQNAMTYEGFRFADGGCSDNKGNFYFVDSLDKKIYRIDEATHDLNLFFESPYKINSVGFDTRDNIVIVGEYAIPEEATLNGKPYINELPEDSYGTSYGMWYNPQAYPVVFSIDSNGEIKNLEKINIGDIEPMRVLYPGNRWRDGSDFADVVGYNPKKAYLATDGVTIIPCHYDLIRSNHLARSKPGKHLYSIDEMYKRVFRCDVSRVGLLTNPEIIVNEGDFCVRKYNEKLYVGDDNVKVYDETKYLSTIHMPERPTTFDFNRKGDTMYLTSRNKVYIVKE